MHCNNFQLSTTPLFARKDVVVDKQNIWYNKLTISCNVLFQNKETIRFEPNLERKLKYMPD